MNSKQLLESVREHAGAAHAIAFGLASAAASGGGLPVAAARPELARLNDHLRVAASAALALSSLAAGNPPPKRGD